jgi:hypothetical protein
MSEKARVHVGRGREGNSTTPPLTVCALGEWNRQGSSTAY